MKIVNVNTTLSFRIHSQVSDQNDADRLLKFMSVWGNGSPDQYEKDGKTYISAIAKELYEDFSFDTILSYEDAQSLRMGILGQIRQLVKKCSIKRIHMVISSSVAFTFFLAQGYSEHHDPEIIVYHYDKGKYTWGINMSEQGKNAYIAIEE